jgi:hypothetical protein
VNKKSFFSGIALVTALGLSMTTPAAANSSLAKSVELGEKGTGHSESLQQPNLIAARPCYYKRVYHKGYYSIRHGRKQYHPGYYARERVCI